MDFNYFFLEGNKSDIGYFLIIQDVLGILIAFLGLKLSIVYFLYIIKQGEKLKNTICLIGSIMLIFSGINLVFFNRGLYSWLISIVFIMIGLVLGKLAYIKP